MNSDEVAEIENNEILECPICLDDIKEEQRIWYCCVCRVTTHLSCAENWHNSTVIEEGKKYWNCPVCRERYNDPPKGSYCFCGQSLDSKINSNTSPVLCHCCNNICNRLCPVTRGNKCTHPCTLPCHGGLCPPCSEIYIHTCFCGKDTFKTTCSDIKKLLSINDGCGHVCSKLLNCGVHKCKELCHPDTCQQCTEIDSQYPCYCGQTFFIRYCGQTPEKLNYHCQKVCNKILPCKSHRCQMKCHLGNCEPCNNDPVSIKTCFCGKTSLEELGIIRTKCNDPIPSCKKICQAVLSCRGSYEDEKSKAHKCHNICHPPPCDPCKRTSESYCVCKKNIVNTPCKDLYYSSYKPASCWRECNKTLNCGKHKCTRKCCPPTENHECKIPCEEMATCGVHQCAKFCHSDSTHDCKNGNDRPVFCRCFSVQVKLSDLCSKPFPKCSNECPVKCEYGHMNRHSCHRMDQKCPPCMDLTDRMCVNNHKVISKIPCSRWTEHCMTICGKPLECGHTCRRFCHSDVCMNRPIGGCLEKCQIPRLYCQHPCKSSCHFPLPCPLSSCTEIIQIMCECTFRVETITCDDYTWFIGRIKEINGNFEPKIENSKIKCLMCTDNCKMLSRNCSLSENLIIDTLTGSELSTSKISLSLNRVKLEHILNHEYI